MELPDKKYNIIYADPPWNYNDKRNKPGKNNPSGAGGCAKHYNTMTMDELKSLSVNKISADDCYLFMWVTSPFMKEGIELIEHWNFKYITIPFVWIKNKQDSDEIRGDGIGNYTPNNAEYVLLGRKGKYWRNSTKVKQVLVHPKLSHSEKPNEIRERIVELCGDVLRIELFSRQRYDGWDAWGDELSETIQNHIIEG